MKKNLSIILGMSLMLASCQTEQKTDQPATGVAGEVTTEAATPAAPAAPVKDQAFYQQLLDVFCRQYYGELFKDVMGTRNYVAGYRRVDGIAKADEGVLVYGKHDFEGRFGKEHEDRTFFACVQEDKEKPNEYVVTFAKEKKSLTSLVGKTDSEARSKAFYYDPASTSELVSDAVKKLKDSDYYARMLDKFCQQHYNDLFKDLIGKRKYVAGSLKVDSIVNLSDREVKVYGTHDFEGRTGKDYSDRNFEASIFETKENPNEYNVSFKKEGKRLVTGKSYSESRSKTFIYEE